MIKEEEIIQLLKKALKKRTLKKIGASLLLSEKRLQGFLDKKEVIPTHMRYILKKNLEKAVNTKKTAKKVEK